MTEQTDQQPLNLNINSPALAVDGNALIINDTSGDANLVFFQITPGAVGQKGELQGNVVSNVRLSLTQLKQLKDGVTSALDDFEKKNK